MFKKITSLIVLIALVLASAVAFSSCASSKSTSLNDRYNSTYPGASSAPAASMSNGNSVAPSGGSYYNNVPPYAKVPDAFPDEEYLAIVENAITDVRIDPLLTFSLKVDTASYRNVVRYIDSGNLPPADAVRIEEMINYFSYDIPLTPGDAAPFAIYTEIGPSPFDSDNEIAFVRVKTREIDRADLPSCNLTFLIDTSGSMDSYDKLPLLKTAFSLLVETLTEDDVVSIVTYAGNASVALDSVRGDQKGRILDAINGLRAAGSTAGADGINTAYALAEKNFIKGANNRVLLATDGDFNVGISSVGALESLIRQKRESGIYLTILGFGTENLKDNRMETLAKNGNGNYSYLDSVAEAQKVLVDEMGSNLYTIADDVKAQIEFNPVLVESYRLIGYENRMLADRDFNDDTKDAGEIGVGTDVVLMFEITRAANIEYRYQQKERADHSDELFTVSIRYKEPGESVSKLISVPVKLESYTDFNSADFNFAVSVAVFGHLLRASEYTGSATVERVIATAMDSIGSDNGGYRKEFIDLVKQYMSL